MDLLDEGLRDHVRLQLPMYIAERYGTPPAAMHDASAADSRTRVYITVDIQTSDVIHEIRSPTHSIALRRYKGRSNQRSQRRMSTVWKSSEFLNSDFVITIHAEGLDKPRCFAEVLGARRDWDGDGSTIAMQLTFVPKFASAKVPSQEYIFVIDRSGSMGGASIETAKRTLTMLLHLLPTTQTTFNIFSFGSTVTSLWPRSRERTQGSLAEAVCFLLLKIVFELISWSQTSHVARMSADYGGTEIPQALQSAFNSRGGDRPVAVFLLTDGQLNVRSKTFYPFDLQTAFHFRRTRHSTPGLSFQMPFGIHHPRRQCVSSFSASELEYPPMYAPGSRDRVTESISSRFLQKTFVGSVHDC